MPAPARGTKPEVLALSSAPSLYSCSVPDDALDASFPVIVELIARQPGRVTQETVTNAILSIPAVGHKRRTSFGIDAYSVTY
jgi:hypothetical protein